MKKMIAMLMMAACVLCVSLSGCGGSTSASSTSYEDAFVGTWNAVEITGEESYSKDQLEALRAMGILDVFINLNQDGTAILCNTTSGKSESVEGTWSATSATQATLTINGNSSEMLLDEGILSLPSDSSNLLFEKVDHREPVSSTSANVNSGASGNESSDNGGSEDGSSASAQTQDVMSSAASASASDQGPASSSASTASSSDVPFDVSIDTVEVGADYEGNPALIVTYTWKNNSDKTTSYASSLHAKCFQNGVQLDTAFVFEGVDSDGYMADVRPGYGTTFQMAYKLKDTDNPVEIEVGELFNYKGEILVSKTFEL